MTDYLENIINEQLEYDNKVMGKMDIKYPSDTSKIFVNCLSLQQETGEAMKILKPYWSYWRDSSINKDFENLPPLTEFEKEPLIVELVDCFKFLLSALTKLGVKDSATFYSYWSAKHGIIEKRLKEEGVY